ncbi:peptidoglycan DD-metalloendopeptidase family protein [Streptomyces clavuligerus]|nr:LysM peptidoglycan-binding domain-containing M23 family metallopeptidase [Streptomyces clavuligerus]ANW17216.1 peptidase [Streptomyces clavuligerus]AXU11756.1 peptidase [Streptomyces clavuligerus]MBY6301594.1 peptidoglycan DD-metalloendopeptidase family protein [Streptomyces clavuligerus]QCS04537.1 peptidase [Streptomyces clavuligerus]QPJ96085.1 peptidoglycan DD-metalloendopeptidase family protein [Streptomyces clavuligerus]
MPQGKHRRTRNRSITRGLLAAGTGGAALALPLIGASGAHAASASAAAPSAAVAPATAERSAAAPAGAARDGAPEAAVHRVVAGDHLARIAEERQIPGGWQRLYADNREAVGGDPALIHPGLELTLAAGADGRDRDRGDDRPAARAAAAAGGQGPAAAPAPAVPTAPAVAAVPQAEEPAAPASGGWTTPLASGGVTTPYRATGSLWSSGYHTGVDFSAATGTPVRSVGPGTVVSAGWNGAYGNEIVVRHADGTYSQYAHLSAVSVAAGQGVTGGQEIGLVGSTGNSSGPHLHLEIRTGTGYGSDIDPVAHLRQYGVTL